MKRTILGVFVSLLAISLVFGSQASSVKASSTYPSGSLVNDGGTIYFISGTTKVPFTNWQSFVGLGYSLNQVVNGDTSGYTASSTYAISTANAAHPWGSWVSHNGTVYYSTQSGLVGVPTPAVFTANGGQWKFVVPANSYDLTTITPSSTLANNDSRVYSPTNPNPIKACPAWGCNGPEPTPTPTPITNPTSGTSVPTVTGPTSLQTNVSGAYSVMVTDTNSTGYSGGLITYTINWTDGTAPAISTPLASGVAFTASHAWTLSGTYPVQITATPALGTISTATYSVVVGASTMSVSTPTVTGPTTIQAGTAGTYSVSATDTNSSGYSGGLITYLINWTDGTSAVTSTPLASGAAFTASHTFTAPGTYPIQITVTPGLGSGTVINYSVTVSASATASMTASTPVVTGSTSVQTNTSSNYTFTSTDTNTNGYSGGLITYTVNWGDNSASSVSSPLASGVIYAAPHTWSTAGTYVIAVNAVPALGNSSSLGYMVTVSASGTASMNTPAPTISGPTSVQAGTQATYSVSTTNPYSNTNTISYTINWTDGTSAAISSPLVSGTAFTASHTWTLPGTYPIQVIATPGMGTTATSTYQVVVH